MHTDRAITRMIGEPVAMRPIVDRKTDACKNIKQNLILQGVNTLL